MNINIWEFVLTIYRYILAIVRDVKAIWMQKQIKPIIEKLINESTVFGEFEKLVQKQPYKACIIFNDKIWTFKDLYDYSNHIACVFMKKFNLKKGDCVALFMENKPEYVGIWLGLSKVGIVIAFINTNLKTDSLLHCISAANSSLVICDQVLEESMDTIREDLEKKCIPVIIDGHGAKLFKNAHNLQHLLDEQPLEIVQSEEKVTAHDTMLYVFTSGTTGVPKPALIKQSRVFGPPVMLFKMCGIRDSDIVYVTLPIYHANGGVVGIGSAVMCGATVVLRKKFSASNFWKDCIKHNCTLFFYIGEVCRFLVNQPPSPLDRQHKIRMALGNGMRANIWQEFHKRFGIECCELYGSSEGNCTLINLDRKMGACGFIPLINRLFPVVHLSIIKIDEQMNPIRDENGFCIKCKPGEKGLIIGIMEKSPQRSFDGYVNDPQATRKKIIENVFKKGQNAFNSGDLMVMDKYGYVYFCDRLGDTFRWKGENVSTVEVENIISKHLNWTPVVVYGVEIPGEEGRAGMATIRADLESIDLKKFTSNIANDLPAYARPLFLRFSKNIDYTGTFKTSKLRLTNESYNVNEIKDDKVLYFHSAEKVYKLLTADVYSSILNKKASI